MKKAKLSNQTLKIIEIIPKLSIIEQIAIAETVLRSVQDAGVNLANHQQRNSLEIAAKLAILDYITDDDLVAFTELDGEDFYEYTEADLAKVNYV